MSPEKLKQTLAAILKDFAPWPDAPKQHHWFGLSPSTVELSSEQKSTLQPYILFIAFVTFSGYPYNGHAEKIAWSIPVLFKGVGFLISDQKFGLRIHPLDREKYTHDLGKELVERLRQAVRIVEALIKPFMDDQIKKGDLSIANKLHLHGSRYAFFRKKAKQAFNLKDKGVDRVEEWNRRAGANRRGYFYANAALDGYFSYLEHFLILLLPFHGYDPSKDDLLELLNSNWGVKWKRIFDLASNLEAERVYHELVKIKGKFRNPLSHGGFDRDGGGVFVHVKGVGAIPTSMSKFDESIHYGFNPIGHKEFKEICRVIDQSEKFFKTGDIRLATHCVSMGVDISFDQRSMLQYAEAMMSEEAMEHFIDYRHRMQDDAANMDW